MKTLLIPPIPNLDLARDRSMHLTLAHLYEDACYRNFYYREAGLGKYIILDNSAHENQVGQGVEYLMTLAYEIGAKEIVLPDHLFDARDTVQRTADAIGYLVTLGIGSEFHYMVVPQGETPQEYEECLMGLLWCWPVGLSNFPPVLGISKDYEIWEGGLLKLLKDLIVPVADNYRAEIHLLGWGRDLWALRKISQTYGERIRSIDSAKPFVYARESLLLDPSKAPPQYPTRSKSYFQELLLPVEREIALKNIEAFDSMVNHDHSLPDS